MHTDDLAHFDAANIVRPLSLEDFRAEVSERSVLYRPQAVPRQTVEKVFSLDAFDNLLTSRPLHRAWLEIIHVNGRVERDNGSNAPLTLLEVGNRIRSGASVRVLNVQNFSNEVAEVASVLSRGFGEPVQANLYFTPENGSGLKRHFDDHDVWILQCWGKKRWTLHDRYSNRVELPLIGERFNPDVHRMQGEKQDVTLEPGDCLYVPRGMVHSVQCAAEVGSLHLTFGLHGSTNQDLLIECIRVASREQLALRKKMAAGVHADRKAVFEKLRATLEAVFTDENLSSAWTSLIGSGIDRMFSPTPGAISSVIRGRTLIEGATVRLRRNLTFHRQKLREGCVLITQHQRTWLDDEEAAMLDDVTTAPSVRVATLIARCGESRARAFVENMSALGLLEVVGG